MTVNVSVIPDYYADSSWSATCRRMETDIEVMDTCRETDIAKYCSSELNSRC